MLQAKQGDLISGLSELIASVRRDGTLLEFAGGNGVGSLNPCAVALGNAVESVWPAAVLRAFGADQSNRAADGDPSVRFSFGPTRHHVMNGGFIADIEHFLDSGTVAAERFELRIAERSFVARDPQMWTRLVQRGVQLIVDEVGRKLSSFDRLARAPFFGLQLDRSWVTRLAEDEVARKVCRAGVGVATALGLTPIATGVDSEEQRTALVALGCRQGLGDLFPGGAQAAPQISSLQKTQPSR